MWSLVRQHRVTSRWLMEATSCLLANGSACSGVYCNTFVGVHAGPTSIKAQLACGLQGSVRQAWLAILLKHHLRRVCNALSRQPSALTGGRWQIKIRCYRKLDDKTRVARAGRFIATSGCALRMLGHPIASRNEGFQWLARVCPDLANWDTRLKVVFTLYFDC